MRRSCPLRKNDKGRPRKQTGNLMELKSIDPLKKKGMAP